MGHVVPSKGSSLYLINCFPRKILIPRKCRKTRLGEGERDSVGLVNFAPYPSLIGTEEKKRHQLPCCTRTRSRPVFETRGAQSLTALVVPDPPSSVKRRNQEVLLDGRTTPKMQRAPLLFQRWRCRISSGERKPPGAAFDNQEKWKSARAKRLAHPSCFEETRAPGERAQDAGARPPWEL